MLFTMRNDQCGREKNTLAFHWGKKSISVPGEILHPLSSPPQVTSAPPTLSVVSVGNTPCEDAAKGIERSRNLFTMELTAHLISPTVGIRAPFSAQERCY